MKKGAKLISMIAAAAMTLSAVSFSAGASYYGENLLTNPDAASGVKGWKDADGAWIAGDSGKNISEYDGKFFMPDKFKCKDGESTCIYQDIPLKNCAGKGAQVRGYLCTTDKSHKDKLIIKLEYLDAKGQPINWISASTKWSDSWGAFSAYGEIPDNAAKARIYLIAENHSGDYAEGCFDDVSFIIEGVKRSDLITDKNMRKRRSYYVKKGDSFTADGVFPKAGKGKIKWSVSDKKIVMVDSSGKITAKDYGTAVVTAKYGKEKVRIKVEVD